MATASAPAVAAVASAAPVALASATASPPPPPSAPFVRILEVLPRAGLVYSEKATLSEALCKPKLMPIKSEALERLEQMEKAIGATSER